MGVSFDLVGKGMGIYFMFIDKCCFCCKVVLGDVLELYMIMLCGGGKVWKFEGCVMVNGEIVVEVEVMVMFNCGDQG